MNRTYQLIIVANRLPVRRRRKGGSDYWDTSPGGLVSAIMPILRRERETGRGGAWVGWSGSRTRSFDRFEHEGVENIPVNLAKADVGKYYDGMANAALWPLYHDCVRPPTYNRTWWDAYRRANEQFAHQAAEVAAQGATIWVQDYHLHLVPGKLRERRPDLRIGFFLHIPFPSRRLFAQAPWRREILEGTLGADVIGFQTDDDAENFLDAACRMADARRDGAGAWVDGRRLRIGGYPISIDAARIDAIARSDAVHKLAVKHKRRVNGRKILLGVDRMDYTKGIPHRLHAYRELLAKGRVSPDEVVLVQSCVPTRERVGAYAELRSEIEALVGQINGEHGDVGLGSVHYLRQTLGLEELVALYLAADVALVTPVRDGMNLVAKEFVAARHDEAGALVLSEFTGAACELHGAIPVNPHDLGGMASAIERALNLDPEDERRRMALMRERVFANDVFAWADSFLRDLRAEASRPVRGRDLQPRIERRIERERRVGALAGVASNGDHNV